jgi:hypothetical protein
MLFAKVVLIKIRSSHSVDYERMPSSGMLCRVDVIRTRAAWRIIPEDDILPE